MDSFQDALVDGQMAARALGYYRERFADKGLFENQLIPGIDDLLRSLCQAGIQCSVATSKPRVFASQIVEYFNLAPWLQAVFGSELDGARGDKTELIRFALEQTGHGSGDSVMLGDRHHDITGARNNGVATIGVTWGFGSDAELRKAGADAIVNEVPQLLDYWDLPETAGVMT